MSHYASLGASTILADPLASNDGLRPLYDGPLLTVCIVSLRLSWCIHGFGRSSLLERRPPPCIRWSPTGSTMSDKPQLLAVNLARCINSSELAGLYFVHTLPQPDIMFVSTQIVASGRHALPITGAVNPEPSHSLGVSPAPLLRVLLGALQHRQQLRPRPSSGSRRRARCRLV